MIKREQLIQEIKKFVLSPAFFVFVLGIVVSTLAVFFPAAEEYLKSEGVVDGYANGPRLARVYASQLGSLLLFLPPFAVALSAVRDKEERKRGGSVFRDSAEPVNAVLVRFCIQTFLLFIPVLIACCYMWVYESGMKYSSMFVVYAFAWLLPTVVFETALVTAVTEWARTALPGILLALVFWVFSQGSTADTGDYNSCIAVRHEIFGGESELAAGNTALIINRIVIVALAAGFVVLAVFGNKIRRKAAH